MRVTLVAVLLAAHAAPAAPVPSPTAYFGHPIGQDRTSLAWDQVTGYFRALEKASGRIRVRDIGKTVEGRTMIAAFLAAPETLQNLERYNAIQKKLVDPRAASEAEALKLAAAGKAVVMITCSIHSTEVASTHTAAEFAYRLLTQDTAKFRAILENVIFILVPSLNPDGVDLVTNWYRKTLDTPFEGATPPELYHKYVGHDNNRDWYIFSQPETRNTISQLHNVWHPQIVYDVHQQGPYASRMFVPPWMDPIEPNIDPILAQQCNMFGMGMAADLTAAGKKGVAVNAMYDFWTPGRHYQAYHHGMRILSESASARLSSPITVKPEQILSGAQGYDPKTSSWNHLEPWLGGEWKLGDIIDYQLIAWESLLYQAATRREDLLRNFHRMAKRAVDRRSPHAFVLPAGQLDPGSARKLVETLSFGLVEVERASAPFSADGRQYAAGSYVIRMRQPFSSFAKTLLEKQHYPDLRLYPGGPPKRPYDVTAHTLPLLMGVEAVAVKDSFSAPLERARDFPFQQAAALPPGALAASDTDSWKAVNRVWRKGSGVWRDPATGHFYTAAREGARPLARPRIGLFRSGPPSMDEGWTRWLLEQFGFVYSSVRHQEFIAGSLRVKYDVILFPDQSPGTIHSGYRAGSMPEEFTGGLGDTGAANLKKFVEEGGRAVFLNDSTEYAVTRFGLKLKNVLEGVPPRDFYSPGSLINVTLEDNWLTHGVPREATFWNEGSPAWEPGEGFAGTVAARYPASGLLASGWLLGEKYIAGRAALVDAVYGKGRVILFGCRPQYRAQSYQGFKLLFNALAGPY